MKSIILLQTILAFAIGIIALVAVYYLLDSILRRKYQIEERNTSFGIFQAGIILSTSLILSEIIDPAINVIRLFNQSGFTLNNLTMSMAYVILFVLIGIFFTFLVIFGGILALFQMTHVNELKEIKNDNIVISLLSSSILLGLALIMDQYVGHLCEAIVPYPDIISIH